MLFHSLSIGLTHKSVSPPQAETRAEFAERSVAKLEKTIDDLEGMIFPNPVLLILKCVLCQLWYLGKCSNLFRPFFSLLLDSVSASFLISSYHLFQTASYFCCGVPYYPCLI